MAERDETGDEYEFSDLDGLETVDPLSGDTFDAQYEMPKEASAGSGFTIIRNGLVVVVSLILLILIYSWFSSSHKKDSSKENIMPAPIQPVIIPPKVEPEIIQPQVTAPPPVSSGLTQKVSAMALSQQNLRDDVTNISNQLGTVGQRVDDINSKISELNQTISQLASRMEAQSEQLEKLIDRTRRPIHKKRVMSSRGPVQPALVYYIQAAIPGRAWLIASNGSTITVREGSEIAGYGVVRLIDPNQGRVLTSSGRVIRFSQQDS